MKNLGQSTIRYITGIVFLTSGVLKATNSEWANEFLSLLPPNIVPAVSLLTLALPWVEVGLGILTLEGSNWRVCADITICLLVLFFIPLLMLWASGISACGCGIPFLPEYLQTPEASILRNTLWLVLLIKCR